MCLYIIILEFQTVLASMDQMLTGCYYYLPYYPSPEGGVFLTNFGQDAYNYQNIVYENVWGGVCQNGRQIELSESAVTAQEKENLSAPRRVNHILKSTNSSMKDVTPAKIRCLLKNSNKLQKKSDFRPRQRNQLQKQGRNANSNLLRMFFRRVQAHLRSDLSTIQSIIYRHSLQIRAQDFKVWMQTNKVEHRNYIRVPSVRKLFTSTRNTSEFSKILRILLVHFLEKESIISYLTSKRIKKESMVHNYGSIRNIVDEIFNSEEEK